MTSHTTERFREALAQLPEPARRQATEAYRLFRQNPQHPSLRFKQVHPTGPIWSARVGSGYRAVGVRDRDEIVRFRIGSHADYDHLIAHL